MRLEIIRTDGEMRDIFYTLFEEDGKYYIESQGNISPNRVGNSVIEISQREKESIEKAKDSWNRMNYLTTIHSGEQK